MERSRVVFMGSLEGSCHGKVEGSRHGKVEGSRHGKVEGSHGKVEGSHGKVEGSRHGEPRGQSFENSRVSLVELSFKT
jgi:hypothetical protein